jgi:hypothetical protein
MTTPPVILVDPRHQSAIVCRRVPRHSSNTPEESMKLGFQSRLGVLFAALLATTLVAVPFGRAEEEEYEPNQPPLEVPLPGAKGEPTPITATQTAVVYFSELEQVTSTITEPLPGVRTWMPNEHEPPAEPHFPPAPELGAGPEPPELFVASPAPFANYQGLDDVAMVDSLYIVIPPDISGGVGLTKVMEAFNNNYRIRDKATGVTISTVGTATFWAPVVAVAERASLTDPRVLYDPYNNRWITAMQTVTSGAGKLLIGVSQTSDPSGAWFLYNFNSAQTVDFPIVGFNKNWISLSINAYTITNTFNRGINLVIDYPQARAGVGTGTLFTHAVGTHFCSAPSATYSSTENNLYVVTHLSSAGATYVVDVISGTPAAPVYTNGVTQTRTGGGWTQPSGNILPQSAPNAGASACGATPCRIETQDAQVRSAPVFRGGFLYYTQTIGLPAGGLTRTAVQWTRINAVGGAFQEGGRIDDPTATATNGGKWYAYPHIAVNSVGDFIVGYSQFSSAQHPSAGYSLRMAGDGAGTIRDPFIYKVGDDYYHKTFSTTTGRNRWGDFSTAQVDPSDDRSLWTLQEYAKTRPGTDDGNTGSNSSRWSSWWAGVKTAYTITASAGPNGSISPAGATLVPVGSSVSYTITPNACYRILDVLVDGVSQGPIANYSFTNVTADHTISATFALNTYTIVASAGAGGSISPSGNVVVNCGDSQTFTITPDACYSIADVLVDGGSVGPVGTYTFNNVTANHTIQASFTLDTYTITATAGPGGMITPSGAVNVNCGGSQTFDIEPTDKCWAIADVLVDGVSVGPVSTYTFTDVQANHTIDATFVEGGPFTITATAGPGGSITPSGAVPVMCGDDQGFTIVANVGFVIDDVVVDGGSVGAVGVYNFVDVQANHTIHATFRDVSCPYVEVLVPNGGEALIIGISTNLTWNASDNVGVTCVDLLLSRTGSSGPYVAIVSCIANSGSYAWTVTGPATSDAWLKVVARDEAGNECEDISNEAFAIEDVVVPILLSQFQVNALDDGVELRWSVSDAATFIRTGIERGDAAEGPFVELTAPVREENGKSVLLDRDVTAGQVYWYRLSGVTRSGQTVNFEPLSITAGRPVTSFNLAPIKPNPSRGVAHVTFTVPQVARVTLGVFDIQGRQVASLADRSFEPGRYDLTWNGEGAGGRVPAGTYFIHLESASTRLVQRVVIVH